MRRALITGASGGIGLELAKLFAKDKYSLILVARDDAKLKSISEDFKKQYGTEVKAIVKDLSQPGAAHELYDEINRDTIEINALVNNAGFGGNGKFAETDLNVELDMIVLNDTALVTLTKLFLPGMINRKAGKILNVASTAAFVPGAFMAIYYASKAFVLSFSEALASELKGTGVTVTCLCPGPTSTGFQKRASVENTKLLKAQSVMSAEAVAKKGYMAMMKGKAVMIPGLMNKLSIQSTRFAPRFVTTAITKWLNKQN